MKLMKRTTSALLEPKAFYKVGNIVYCAYWDSYSKVLAFVECAESGTWEVTVMDCDEAGNTTGAERSHWTRPGEHDKSYPK